MLGYLIRRVFAATGILAVTSVVTFALFFVLPGSPAQIICGKSCTPDREKEIEAVLGLNQPVYQQYWEFMSGIFVGRDFVRAGEVVHCSVPCFGYSYRDQQPVWDTLVDRFPATLSLAGGAAILFLTFGIALGVVAALRAQSWFDRVAIAFTLVGASVQIYFLGPLLSNVFANQLGWLPSPRYVPLTGDPVEWFKGLLLPWITLSIVSMAVYARLTRAHMLEAMGEDFVRAGRSRGVSARTLHVKHTGRATLSPVITVFGLDLAGLMSGAIITETVFNIQGIGRLALTAVQNSDLPMIMATVLLGAVLIVVANLIVDVVYSIVDPRVRIT
ncbi:MAG: ABC transporter permease [Sporichthyaceae bacterium]